MSNKKKSHKNFHKNHEIDINSAFSNPQIKVPKIKPNKQNPIIFIFTVLFVVIFILGMILPSLTLFFR